MITIEEAVEKLQAAGVQVIVKNKSNGHLHVFNKNGKLMQYWTNTERVYIDAKITPKGRAYKEKINIDKLIEFACKTW